MTRRKLPRILDDYLEGTDQYSCGPLSDEHLLNEAEWCLYNAYENEASAAYEYNPKSKLALKRYVERMRSAGIVPERDFDN